MKTLIGNLKSIVNSDPRTGFKMGRLLIVFFFLIFCSLQNNAWGSLPETQKMLDGSIKEIEELANTNPSGATKDDRKKAWNEIKNKINRKATLLDRSLYEAWKVPPDVNKSLNFRNPFEKPKERWDERYKMIKQYLAQLNEWHEQLSRAGRAADRRAMNALGNDIIDWVPVQGPSGLVMRSLSYDARGLGNAIREARDIDEALKRLREEIGMVNPAAQEASDILKDLNALSDEFNKLIDRNINPNNKTYSEYRGEEKDKFGKKDKDSPAKPPEPPKTLKSFTGLTKEEKDKLMWCLCKCNITIGVWGGYYPDIKDCGGNGPCASGNWGCLRFYPQTKGQCFESCAKSAAVDPNSIISELNKNMTDDFNKLFNEAKRLINEFWFSSKEPVLDKIKRKVKQDDIGKAASLAKQAVGIMPTKELEVENFIKDTSRRIAPLSGDVVSDLDFDTGDTILEKAVDLDKNNDDARRKLDQVKKWRKDWNDIQSLVPQGDELIKKNEVCEAEKLHDEKIVPADQSFRIPIPFVNPGSSTSPGNEYVPVPKKEKFVRDFKGRLDNALSACYKVSGQNMHKLNDYMTYKDHPNYGGLSAAEVVKLADETLKIKGICDCDRKKIENILATAKNQLDSQNKARELKLKIRGQTAVKTDTSIRFDFDVTGGFAPYSFRMSGWEKGFIKWMGHHSGVVEGGPVAVYWATTSGSYTLTATVTDAKGKSASENITVTVTGDPTSKSHTETPKPVKLDVSLMADKNMLKVGESAYIAAAVTGGKTPYKIKWSGALSGEGATLLFKAQKSGSSIIYAEATDPAGNKGSASITISVEAEKTSAKEPHHDNTTKKAPSSKIGKSKIIVLGSKPETSSSPLKLKVPQGEQSQTLLFTYEHKNIETGKMIYIMEAPSATTFIIEPPDSGASIVRISNPAKWGEEKFFAVDIDKDVKPGKKFTVTAYYSGVPNPQWISNKYLDTGEDAEEYKKKNVKPATAVIEVIGGKITPGKTDTGYNPTNDISYAPGGKTIDTDQIDSLGKTFQDTHINIKKTDSTQGPLTPQPPPPHPTDAAASKGSDSQNTADTPPPYPPYAPPPDNKGTTTDLSKWATDKTGTKGSSNSHGTQKPPTSSGGQQSGSQGSSQGGGGSSTSSQPPPTTGAYVTAKITNRSKQDAHIFAEGESFGPGNRFGPGEKNRPVNVKVPSNNKITFHAGRNGQVIASKAWYYDPAQPGRFPDVIFDDSKPKGYDKLGITTGLR